MPKGKKGSPQKSGGKGDSSNGMGDAQQATTPQTSASSASSMQAPPKRRGGGGANKLLGVMTKRRWFFVCIFLLGFLWAYKAGPPLEKAYIANRHFRDPTMYDVSKIGLEGDKKTIYEHLFEEQYWDHAFFYQEASAFGELQAPVFFGTEQLFAMPDSLTGAIYTHNQNQPALVASIQILSEDASDSKTKKESRKDGDGVSSIAADPVNPDVVYVAQPSNKQIVKMDSKTGKRVKFLDSYSGKKLNGPWGLLVDKKNKYLYFSDICSSGKKCELPSSVYRVSLSNNNKIELVTSEIKNPKGLDLNSDNNKLYVSNCVQNEFSLYELDINDINNVGVNELNGKTLKNPHKIKLNNGNGGCVSDVSVHPNKQHIVTACPGNKWCIIDTQSSTLIGVFNTPNNFRVNGVKFLHSYLWISGNYSLWRSPIKTKWIPK